MDLEKPTDDELELPSKAAGEFVGDDVPQFRIERIFIDPNAAEAAYWRLPVDEAKAA